MRKFEIVFVKQTKVIGAVQPIQTFAKQTIYTTGNRVEIKTPDGFAVVSVTEVLEDIYLNPETDEKKNFN